MASELAIRFVLGGAIVSLFALMGQICRPTTFGGIFGAAPSVALATLALAYAKHDTSYVAVEARSMVIGAAALVLYSGYCAAASKNRKIPVWLAAAVGWTVWLAVSLGVWRLGVLAGVWA